MNRTAKEKARFIKSEIERIPQIKAESILLSLFGNHGYNRIKIDYRKNPNAKPRSWIQLMAKRAIKL